MKAVNFFKFAVVACVVTGSAFLTSTGANAVTDTVGSSVSIGTAISVTGLRDLKWGVMAAPAAGSDLWEMSPSGVLSGGTPGNDLFLDHNEGQFLISGQPNATVDYAVTFDTDFADPSISLFGLIWFPGALGVLNGSGELAVNVGGNLSIGASATTGAHSATIAMTANY